MAFDDARLRMIVISALALDDAAYHDDLALGDVPAWDSVGHLNLVFAIESALGIQFPMDQIPLLTSIRMIKAVLSERDV
jgi:acyl carrier protein